MNDHTTVVSVPETTDIFSSAPVCFQAGASLLGACISTKGAHAVVGAVSAGGASLPRAVRGTKTKRRKPAIIVTAKKITTMTMSHRFVLSSVACAGHRIVFPREVIHPQGRPDTSEPECSMVCAPWLCRKGKDGF